MCKWRKLNLSVELWNGNVWARGVLGELGIALCFSREGVQVLAVEGPCKAVAQPGQRAWRQLLGSEPRGDIHGSRALLGWPCGEGEWEPWSRRIQAAEVFVALSGTTR